MGRRARRPFAAALLIAVVLLAGCDPSNSEDERVRDAIRATLASLESGDADEFCGRLASPEGEQDYIEEFGEPCDQASVERILIELGPDGREALLDPEIAVIKIEGDEAGSTVNGEYLRMRLVDDEWLLDSYEVPATRASIREDAGLEP